MRIAILSFTALTLTVTCGLAGPLEDEHKKLDGEWMLVKVEEQFSKPVAPKGVTLTVKGANGVVKDGNRVENVTLTLDPSKSPKWCAVKNETAGDNMMGIYKLEGDRFTMCLGVQGKRPDRFEVYKDVESILTFARKK